MTVAPVDDETRTYEPRYFAPLFAIEDRHFWFRARNNVISALATQVVKGLPKGFNALEVGCGTGNTLRALEPVCSRGHLAGMDLFAEGLTFARRRVSCPLLQGDIQNSPFRTKFDIIGLFDVLEHLPDDKTVLTSLRAMVKPGGSLLLTVPAKQKLWSYFDEAAHHCRRYELHDLEAKLREAGFEVDFVSYYMFSLYPMMWLKRKVQRGKVSQTVGDRAEDDLRITPGLNELLGGILKLERPLLARRKRLPVGTSLVAIARNPMGTGS